MVFLVIHFVATIVSLSSFVTISFDFSFFFSLFWRWTQTLWPCLNEAYIITAPTCIRPCFWVPFVPTFLSFLFSCDAACSDLSIMAVHSPKWHRPRCTFNIQASVSVLLSRLVVAVRFCQFFGSDSSIMGVPSPKGHPPRCAFELYVSVLAFYLHCYLLLVLSVF